MKMNNIKTLNKYQKIWLTDRYLTYQYLNSMPYSDYKNLNKQINYEIENIESLKENEKPKSAQKLSLNEAYNLYKKMLKFQRGINKISKGNFTDKESVKAIITSISFIINMTKNKKQYEKITLKLMLFAFWQAVIEMGGKYTDFPISAQFLQHSLEEKPDDLFITDGDIVNTIAEDENFQKVIKKIIEKKGKNKNSFDFNSEDNQDEELVLSFNDRDLFFALHLVNLKVSAVKENNKWKLEIKIHDTYDYTEFKNPAQYYNDTNNVSKSILSSSLYNLAALSNHYNVMKKYEIEIDFTINDYQLQ